MNYYEDSDLLAALGEEHYLRLFDRDGDGTADPAVLDGSRVYAQGRIDSRLRASHGTPFTTTIDPFIKGIAVDLAIAYAGESFPTASPEGRAPFSLKKADALERLKDLARDNAERLATGPGEPTASLATTTVQAGVVAGEEHRFFGPFDRNGRCGTSGF